MATAKTKGEEYYADQVGIATATTKEDNYHADQLGIVTATTKEESDHADQVGSDSQHQAASWGQLTCSSRSCRGRCSWYRF